MGDSALRDKVCQTPGYLDTTDMEDEDQIEILAHDILNIEIHSTKNWGNNLNSWYVTNVLMK